MTAAPPRHAPDDTAPAHSTPPPWLTLALQRHHIGLDAAHWTPLSGGRTNLLWRAGDVVVKAYDPASATPLFPNDPQAEAEALRRFAPHGLAPDLIAQGDGWLCYRHLPGACWRDNPAQVAHLLARLHRLPPAPQTQFRAIASGAAALTAQGLAIAQACRATLPPPPAIADPGPVRHPTSLHGDAVAGNVIIGPRGPALIDWQCPATGDAAEDIATFLSPAMQWLYRGKPLSTDEVAAFLAAYPDPDPVARYRRLAPLFRWRMAAHCLWKAERGAADYAQALTLELAA